MAQVKLNDEYTQPINYHDPNDFESFQELEAEVLRLQEQERAQNPTENSSIVHGAHADHIFLQNWLATAVSAVTQPIACWHRKNELIVMVHELDPPPQAPSPTYFPYIGQDAQPELSDLWRSSEERHAEKILQILPLFKACDGRLATTAKHLRELYAVHCLRTRCATAEQGMVDFAADYNRVHAAYPDIQPGESWRGKLERVYWSLCELVDCRHAGMLCCLRNLMGASGFTEVIFAFRNAGLMLFQVELFSHFFPIRFFTNWD